MGKIHEICIERKTEKEEASLIIHVKFNKTRSIKYDKKLHRKTNAHTHTHNRVEKTQLSTLSGDHLHRRKYAAEYSEQKLCALHL